MHSRISCSLLVSCGQLYMIKDDMYVMSCWYDEDMHVS
jgi:hypothetical protein